MESNRRIGFGRRRLAETPADVRIRKAQMDDSGALAVILRELGWWKDISAEPLDATVERVRSHIRLCNTDRSHAVFLAERQGEIVGYAAVHWLPYLFLAGPEGYVSDLFVLEKSRGMGIGSRLLEEIRKEARALGCSRLMLVNSRKRKSYKRKFYRKQGWEERREFANFVLWLDKS